MVQRRVRQHEPEIGRARGDLSAANLLAGLALQFGEGSSRGGPLRHSRDPAIRNLRYADTTESHDRGSILVFAVYEAFLNIVARRTEDLIRLATGGSGVLPTGALHPDLVSRLTAETRKTAKHVLHMCIRALDYCPPVDLTFGDYLRALITADRDNHPADPLGVRDAFMQAFRLRGILPEDAQYFAEESLCWSPVPPNTFPPVKDLVFGDPNGLTRDEKNHNGDVLRKYAQENAEELGFRPGKFISVPSFHPASRFTPDGRMRIDMVVEMAQKEDVHFDPKRPELGSFPMRAGSTLLITKPPLKNGEFQDGVLRYLIRKRLDRWSGEKRQKRQRDFALREGLLEGNDANRFHMNFNMLHSGL